MTGNNGGCKEKVCPCRTHPNCPIYMRICSDNWNRKWREERKENMIEISEWYGLHFRGSSATILNMADVCGNG